MMEGMTSGIRDIVYYQLALWIFRIAKRQGQGEEVIVELGDIMHSVILLQSRSPSVDKEPTKVLGSISTPKHTASHRPIATSLGFTTHTSERDMWSVWPAFNHYKAVQTNGDCSGY